MDQLLKLFNESELKEYGELIRYLFLEKITHMLQLRLGDDSGAFTSLLVSNDGTGALEIIKRHNIDLQGIAQEVVQELSEKLGFELMEQLK